MQYDRYFYKLGQLAVYTTAMVNHNFYTVTVVAKYSMTQLLSLQRADDAVAAVDFLMTNAMNISNFAA